MAEPGDAILVSVPSHPRFLGPLRELVLWSAKQEGFHRELAEEVTLAVTEGFSNVIRHCYGDRHDRRIDVELAFLDGGIQIRIDDYGEFVDPDRIRSRELREVRPGGLGVYFMRQVMDEVSYERNSWGGTRLTLVKQLKGARRAEKADREG
ncbi:MAG: ATP-binding protein [Planctomycetota bacterium]